MRNRRRQPARANGFSLVELLVAMVIGLALVAGVVSVFAGNRRSSELNTATANLQESARFALEAIAHDTRMSGYQGCIDPLHGSFAVRAQDAPTTNLLATASRGALVESETAWKPAAPPTLAVDKLDPKPVVGTHALVLQYGGADTAGLADQMKVGGIPSASGVLTLDRDIGLQVNDLAIAADCISADLFRVSGVGAGGTQIAHDATKNVDGALQRAYGGADKRAQTTVTRFHANVYYVGDTGLDNDAGDSIFALYQQSLPYDTTDPDYSPPVELVQGVENLRVAFGVRDASDRLTYVPPNAANYDPTAVESVQIGLLMTSDDAITDQDDARSYVLAGQRIDASTSHVDGSTHARDRRHRLAFNTTVKVRNRRGEDS